MRCAFSESSVVTISKSYNVYMCIVIKTDKAWDIYITGSLLINLICVKKFNYETLFAISKQLVHCQRNHTPLSYPSQWLLLPNHTNDWFHFHLCSSTTSYFTIRQVSFQSHFLIWSWTLLLWLSVRLVKNLVLLTFHRLCSSFIFGRTKTWADTIFATQEALI